MRSSRVDPFEQLISSGLESRTAEGGGWDIEGAPDLPGSDQITLTGMNSDRLCNPALL